MKITVDAELMKKELGQISSLVSKNVVIPMIQCVKMDFEKGVLSMTASDLKTQVTIISEQKIESKSKFSVVIHYADFYEICNNVIGPITIEEKEEEIRLTHSKGKFKLSYYGKPEDFPLIAPDDEILTIEVDEDFFYTLTGANACGSKNPNENHVHNALIHFMTDKTFIVGTDKICMYIKNMPLKSGKMKKAQINEDFVAMCKSFHASTISVGEKFIKAECKNTVVISRLSEYFYIDYSCMLPQSVTYNLLLNRKDLIQSIKTIGVAFDKMNKDIIFSFEPGKVILKAYDNLLNKSADVFIETQHDINIEPVRLSGGRFLSLLNTINDENIKLSFTEPCNPVYMQPEDDADKLLLIVPLKFI